jgi:hypothetical protein
MIAERNSNRIKVIGHELRTGKATITGMTKHEGREYYVITSHERAATDHVHVSDRPTWDKRYRND